MCASAAAPLKRNGSRSTIQTALEQWTIGATSRQAHVDAFLAQMVEVVT